MTHHVAPEELMAFAEGRSSENASARVRSALQSCAHCRRLLDDFRATCAHWSKAYGIGPADPDLSASTEPVAIPSARFDRAYARAVRRLDPADGSDGASAAVARVARRSRTARMLFRLTAAAALLVAVRFTLWNDADRTVGPSVIRGALIVAEASETLRGGGGRTYHWDLVFGAGGELAVFRVMDGRVEVAYPDPRPGLGVYGRTAPFSFGERVRIPPAPTLDPILRPDDEPPVGIAVRFAVPPDPAALAEAARAATAVAAGGLEAVRAMLAARFGEAVLLVGG